MIERLSDWEQRLSDYIIDNRDRVFDWGKHDCCTNYFDAVEAMSGQDLWHFMRGKYSTELGAFRALKRHADGDIESTFDRLMNPVATGFLQRGDAVWNGESVGICMGAYALFLGEPDSGDGMVRVPRSDWVKGWTPWALS